MPTFDATDLDSSDSTLGTVHENVANTDHTNDSELKSGYSYQNPYLASDLVGYWPQYTGSTTAEDFSGNGNDGSVNSPAEANGILGCGAYEFDGGGDYIEASPIDPDATGEMTYSVWVNADYWSGNDFIISQRDTSNSDTAMEFCHADDGRGFSLFLKGSSGFYDIFAGQNAAEDTWIHVVAIYRQNGNEEIWVNALQEADQNVIDGVFTPDNLRIGAAAGGGGTIAGRLSEVRIYDRALSQIEIVNLYNVVAQPNDLNGDYKPL